MGCVYISSLPTIAERNRGTTSAIVNLFTSTSGLRPLLMVSSLSSLLWADSILCLQISQFYHPIYPLCTFGYVSHILVSIPSLLLIINSTTSLLYIKPLSKYS